MAVSVDEPANPPEFSWRSILARAFLYARESPITLLVITALWWALPHPLLVDVPSPGEVPSADAGPLVFTAIAMFLGWLVAAVGLRVSFSRYIAGPAPGSSSAFADDTGEDTRSQMSFRLLHFLLALGIMWLVAAVAAALFLVLTGLIILPASRVDGAALYSSYVAPGIILVVFLAVRIRYSLGIETPLQHEQPARRGLRNGVALFRERRLIVAAVVIAVHLFYALEPLAVSIVPDLNAAHEVVRGLAAVVRTASLVAWLSFYHELWAVTEEELE